MAEAHKQELANRVGLDDIFIAVMGMTGVGKTTFISHCTDDPPLEQDESLLSSMSGVTLYSTKFEDRAVHLVDVPGFDNSHRPDEEVFEEQAYWLLKCRESGVKLSGIVYLHRITDPRLQGSSYRGLQVFKALCGSGNYHAIVLATTMWDRQPDELAEGRQRELTETSRFWGDIIACGGKATKLRYSEPSSAQAILRYLVWNNRTLKLQIQHEMVDEGRRLSTTTAGEILWRSWRDEKDRLERKVDQAWNLMKTEMQHHQEKHTQERIMEIAELEQEIRRRLRASDELEISSHELTQKWDKRLCNEAAELNRMLTKQERTLAAIHGNAQYPRKLQEYQRLRRIRNRRLENCQLMCQGLGTAASIAGVAIAMIGGAACVMM